MKKFPDLDITKPIYYAKDNRLARLISADIKGPQSLVIAYQPNNLDYELVYSVFKDGRYSGLDEAPLFTNVSVKVKHNVKVWLGESGYMWSELDAASCDGVARHILVKTFEFECEETPKDAG